MKSSQGIVFYLQGDELNFLVPVTLRSLRDHYQGDIHVVMANNSCNILREKMEKEGISWDMARSVEGSSVQDIWCSKALGHIRDYPFDVNAYYDLDHIFLKDVEQEIFDRAKEHGIFCEQAFEGYLKDVILMALNWHPELKIDRCLGVNGGFVVSRMGAPQLLRWSKLIEDFRTMRVLHNDPEELSLSVMAWEGSVDASPWRHSVTRGTSNDRGEDGNPIIPDYTRALHCKRHSYLKFPIWRNLLKRTVSEDYLGLGTFSKEYLLSSKLLEECKPDPRRIVMSPYPDVTTRDQFHKIINDRGYMTVAEIGLGKGPNAIYLLDNTQISVLHSIDNWAVRSNRKEKDSTLAQFVKYGRRFHFIDHDSSTAADKFFKDGSLDYVYIDGDHRFNGAYKDLVAWWPKVKKGGFFGGHDYLMARKCQVQEAADKFFKEIGRQFFVTVEHLPSFWLIK